uniref:C2 domain-containing protein n=1 Tax=Kalanchoe fedtschenkoi TaxID=63787 RepID=A0A7N0UA01_KALFE
MESKSSSLEVKVLNCKDLKPTNFNFFQRLNVFVTVALASDDPERRPKSQHQKTTTEEERDGNLEWNREMSFDLDGIRLDDCDHLFLTFAFFTPGNILFDDKLLGDVRVPLKDLVEEWGGVARFASYEVRTIDGKPNGVLHFSHRLDLKGKEMSGCSCYPPAVRIDGYTPTHDDQNQNPNSKIEYPAIDWGNGGDGSSYGLAQEVGFTRPAEVVHTAHNGLPVSGAIHASHEGMPLPAQQLNSGYYAPPPPHFYPPPPPLPPHMLYPHPPHSPSSPHPGSPFHSFPPPPPPPADPWAYGGGYENRSNHGVGESRFAETRDRGLGDHYPNYWSGR